MRTICTKFSEGKLPELMERLGVDESSICNTIMQQYCLLFYSDNRGTDCKDYHVGSSNPLVHMEVSNTEFIRIVSEAHDKGDDQ
jgi:hypothetical protein